jgi:hypothetical protein
MSLNLKSGSTGAVSQFDRMHGDKVVNHGERIFASEAQQQCLEFFRSGIANPHATIITPYP